MRPPRFRTRTLMIAVAAVAVISSVARWVVRLIHDEPVVGNLLIGLAAVPVAIVAIAILMSYVLPGDDLSPREVAPISRPRITVRRLMVAVALLAAVLGLGVESKRRQERFAALAAYHAGFYRGSIFIGGTPEDSKEFHAWLISDFDWHATMAEKYRLAARYPFLPVLPDPPEPK